MKGEKGKGLLIGLIVGAIVGAIAALLLAPKSGKETRGSIRKTFGRVMGGSDDAGTKRS